MKLLDRKTELTLSDSSDLIVKYNYWPGFPGSRWEEPTAPDFEILEIFHELPQEKDHNGVPLASTLTNLTPLISAIIESPVFSDLMESITAQIIKEEEGSDE